MLFTLVWSTGAFCSVVSCCGVVCRTVLHSTLAGSGVLWRSLFLSIMILCGVLCGVVYCIVYACYLGCAVLYDPRVQEEYKTEI